MQVLLFHYFISAPDIEQWYYRWEWDTSQCIAETVDPLIHTDTQNFWCSEAKIGLNTNLPS